MVTTCIFKNGIPVDLVYDVEKEKWVYKDTGFDVGEIDLFKIDLSNMICGAKIFRKDTQENPDKARKLSMFITKIEEGLMWLNSLDTKEHHALPQER